MTNSLRTLTWALGVLAALGLVGCPMGDDDDWDDSYYADDDDGPQDVVDPDGVSAPEDVDDTVCDEAPTEPDVVLDKHESVLLDALARRPALLETVYREQTHHLVGDERLQDFIEQVAVTWTLDGGPDVVAAAEALEPGPLRRALTGALVTEHAIADDRVDEVFADTTRTMKIRWMTAEMRRISERLRATQDPEAVELLMKRQSELNHWLNDLRRTANPAP